MIGFIVKKFIGSKNEREVKRLRPMVAQINALEAELQKLSPTVTPEMLSAAPGSKDEVNRVLQIDARGKVTLPVGGCQIARLRFAADLGNEAAASKNGS